MTVKVKICGITNIDDALDAIELGADYLGFIFYPDSKRFIDVQSFSALMQEVPFTVPKVGVFVNYDQQAAVNIATDFDLNLLQFHGDESPEYCQKFARPIIKAIRPEKESDLEGLADYKADYILVDSFVQNSYGGTGVVSNWDLARKAKEVAPIFLSGGLNPDNIEMAIQSVEPFAVDVCSGVEKEPGKKSYRLMEEFIKKAKSQS